MMRRMIFKIFHERTCQLKSSFDVDKNLSEFEQMHCKNLWRIISEDDCSYLRAKLVIFYRSIELVWIEYLESLINRRNRPFLGLPALLLDPQWSSWRLGTIRIAFWSTARSLMGEDRPITICDSFRKNRVVTLGDRALRQICREICHCPVVKRNTLYQ